MQTVCALSINLASLAFFNPHDWHLDPLCVSLLSLALLLPSTLVPMHHAALPLRHAGESVFDVATPKVKKALGSMQAAGDDEGVVDDDEDSFLDPAHKKK